MKLTAVKTPAQTPANVIPFPSASEPESKILEVVSVEPTTIRALIQRARAISRDCEDFMVEKANTNNVRFNDTAGLTYTDRNGTLHNSPLSRYSLGQLGTKLGVPATYLEKCVHSGRIELAQDNVNSWLEDYHKDLFIREYRGHVRGILSSRYAVCDTHDILNVVNDVVDLSEYHVEGNFLNEERLHVRLVQNDMLPIDGEDLFAGLFIDSSDVGRSILTVKFGIYKQVCTNGLFFTRAGGVLFEQRHVGITTEEFYEGLSAGLKNVDVLSDHAVEWVKASRNKKLWGYDLKKTMTDEEMADFIAHVRSATKLPEESAKKVVDLMNTNYERNRWGLINSITEVAQDFTLERRLDLERVAGNLLVA